MKIRKSSLRNEKGFTLIEMAIVLVIIGLILGSVIKGKDIINSAKQKKFYSNFIKTWELAITSYYDRTGNLLGDSTDNGGTLGTKDGTFDRTYTSTQFDSVNARIKAVGLELPTSNGSNNYQYAYSGVYSGARTISMELYYLNSTNDGVAKNTFYMSAMPTDLAIALDTIIDGQADPRTGTFRSYPDNIYTTWPDASTTVTLATMYLINVP